MAALARTLEEKLQRPVIDETHLKGGYDFPPNLTAGDAEGLVRTVEGLGLELKRARRKIEAVEVEKR
jgi:uncharacterized protein (TIGR03435 family)